MYPVLNYITENYVAYICHIWLAKDDNLMLLKLMRNNQSKAFSINLNAQHTNGITDFDLAVQNGKLVKIHVCTVIFYIKLIFQIVDCADLAWVH